MRIKSWRKFFESVEDSLEDIKWSLVDYDVQPTMWKNSSDIITFRIGELDSNNLERISRLVSADGWQVRMIKSHSICIKRDDTDYPNLLFFWKGDIVKSCDNWLIENYSDLNSVKKEGANWSEYYVDEDDKVVLYHQINKGYDGEIFYVDYRRVWQFINTVFFIKFGIEGIMGRFINTDLLFKWSEKNFDDECREVISMFITKLGVDVKRNQIEPYNGLYGIIGDRDI
jgi:hypothetical protein